MFLDEFKVDSNSVVKEEIEDGMLSITLQDGTTKKKNRKIRNMANA